ncbi:uncharacterized protein Z519_03214 [Cladophialophora bantiana CBS 173.52]|uniref:Heterokaryon incompatibility domain-containing protein n=1 Tax=Cladophialophora bantiana (strain ATCC 10958 / CBS 173.52 / CDC B-1940 / NIH 8579) TaxID=1442370 RepID=A0A0D2GCE5_CLAB1|nr:uncharacterized protein Z519_03214 [Cladophialophora bantiana CBS 173.52]KIW96147.1 hypothetical protein Z519_03214 [Cladophialophora bantiana CBS 173.52]
MIDSFLVDDDNNTLLAISALAEMLDLPQEEIYAGFGGTRSHNWIETLNVCARLLQAGWCINEVATLINRLEGSFVNLLVYLSRVDCSLLSRHHDRCTIAECIYSKIDYTTYRPAHGLGRSGNRLLVRRPESSDDSNCMSYVAISHVWSDRSGNLRENALPSCQLQRIQVQVNSLYPSRNGNVPFWIDTICVPRKLTTRELAILSMRKNVFCWQSNSPLGLLIFGCGMKVPWQGPFTFQLKDAAVAGDRLTTQYHAELPSGNAVIRFCDLVGDRHSMNSELAMLLVCAMARSESNALCDSSDLLDKQDAGSQNELIVQSITSRPDVEEAEYLDKEHLVAPLDILASPNPNDVGASEKEAHITALEYKINRLEAALWAELQARQQQMEQSGLSSRIERQKRPTDKDLPSRWKEATDSPIATHHEELSRMINNAQGYYGSYRYWLRGFDPLFIEGWQSYTETRCVYRQMRLAEATSAIAWRTTSWAGDEAIYLAIITDVDVVTVQQARMSDPMEVLVNLWKTVPRDVLFMHLPRMTTEGLRWMPSSFLDTGKAGSCRGDAPMMHISKNKRGVILQAEGVSLDGARPLTQHQSIFYKGHWYEIQISEHEQRTWADLSGKRGVLIFEISPNVDDPIRGACISILEQKKSWIYA